MCQKGVKDTRKSRSKFFDAVPRAKEQQTHTHMHAHTHTKQRLFRQREIEIEQLAQRLEITHF